MSIKSVKPKNSDRWIPIEDVEVDNTGLIKSFRRESDGVRFAYRTNGLGAYFEETGKGYATGGTTGAGIGALLGGPVGALFGAVIGARVGGHYRHYKRAEESPKYDEYYKSGAGEILAGRLEKGSPNVRGR